MNKIINTVRKRDNELVAVYGTQVVLIAGCSVAPLGLVFLIFLKLYRFFSGFKSGDEASTNITLSLNPTFGTFVRVGRCQTQLGRGSLKHSKNVHSR